MGLRIVNFAAVFVLAIVLAAHAQSGLQPLEGGGVPSPASATVRTPINVSVDTSAGVDADVVKWMIKQPDVLLAAARELDPAATATNSIGEVRLSLEGHTVPCQVEFNASGARELQGRTMLSGILEIQVGPTAEIVAPQDWEHAVSALRPIGRRLTRALASRLERSLTQVESRQLGIAQSRAARAADRSAQFGKHMRDDSEALREKIVQLGLGNRPEAVLVQSIGELAKRKQDLELERAGLQARTQSLQDQLQISAKRIDEAAQSDEIVQNYQKVVDLQRQRLQNLTAAHQSGHLGHDELSRGEIDLATATVELAKAQRTAAHPRTQELERLSGELANATVLSAECEAKLKYVDEQLEKSMSSWRQEEQLGEKLRAELSDLQKRAELFEEENRRSQVESVRLHSNGGAMVEIFSAADDQ